jgi:MFS transporter, DHA1 family, inner membrane transport protein
MSSQHGVDISAGQLASALAIGTIAVLMVGVQPILLGALVEARQVSLEGVGIVAMAEIIMLGLGVVLGDTLLPGAQLRLITIVAALCAAGLDLLTLQSAGDGGMAAVRAGAGLAEGVLIWGTTGVIVRTAQPARIGGVFFVLQTIAQALLGLALANAVIPRWGWAGGFVALGLLGLLPCLLAWLQPARLSPLAPPAVSGFRWSAATLQPLAVVFLQLAALGSFWAYLEPLGQAAGLDARSAQTLVAAVLVMQVVGGSVAALAVRQLPLVPTLVVCSVALAAITATVHQLPLGDVRDFSIASAAFGFVWLFMMPFHIGLAFRADPSGRLAGLVPAAQLLGSAFGPLTASFMVEENNASAVPLLAAAFAVLAAVMAFLIRKRRGAPPVRIPT